MRKSPCTPLRVKAKGKEISRFACSTVYRGRARETCAGAMRGVAALVASAVEEALVAFRGTRGPKPSDETLWASIAWRIGAEKFHHLVFEKIAENNADGWPKNPPAAFQAFIDRRYPKRDVHFAEMHPRDGAFRRNAPTGAEMRPRGKEARNDCR